MAMKDLPNFASLSPEAQKIVLAKYEALSPEAKKIVDEKISSKVRPSPFAEQEAAYTAKTGIELPKMENIQEGIEEVPGMVTPKEAVDFAMNPTVPLAKAVGETTQIPEKIRGPLSGAIGVAPEVLAAGKTVGMAAAGKFAGAAQGIRNISSAIKEGIKKIPGVKSTLETLKSPSATKVLEEANKVKKPIIDSLARAEKELANLENKFAQQMDVYKSLTQGNAPKQELQKVQKKISELRNQYAKKASELKTAQAEAGKNINAIESKTPGLKMEQIPEVGDTKKLANQMKMLSEKPIEEIKSLGSETIQKQYKLGQVAKRGNLTPEENAFINKGMARLDEARGELHPELKEALQKHRAITDEINNLPENLKAEKASLNETAVKLEQEIKKVESLAKETKEQLSTAKAATKAQIMSRKITAQQNLAELEGKLALDLEKAKKKAGLIKAGIVGSLGVAGLSGAGSMLLALKRLGGRQ